MKRLRIGIDINEANVAQRVGTGQYCYHVLKHGNKREDINFHLYHRDPLQNDLPPENEHWHYHRIGPTRGWIRFGLPLYLLTHHSASRRNDVFWSPAHYAPIYTGCPSVVTIHDLAYEYFPDLFLPSDLYKLKHWSLAAARSATRMIAVSQATKHDLVKLYDIPEDKITVVHNGYDSDIFNLTQKADEKILSNYHLSPNSYLLFLGTIQPRKNAIKLVQAFHLLRESGYKGKLVIAGSIGWLADETLAVIKDSPDAGDIVLTDYVSDQTRKALYSFADVYVLPSFYEGFGVPAIEAMACGTPVAVANNSSLPEVVGDAGLFFNAADPADIARAITEIKSDREHWVKKGLARAKVFSWAKCAKETLDVLLQ
ncbi:MAG: Glycosyl transferase group 1 [Microgenomates group bacterium GW2011_GWA2_46_16]|uniref:Glycosyl transferase group 1 n=1 Tax=Candidatus Amesbacteria bacterium GW2011_GWC2_47_8 TaxID=1618367 RepID=A0A0G1TN08_9BACT|nr:MAG: Glycosyl transferase group 1 [Microgenomates group bacterium GW2011_GWA2_46_16]KKU83191.1 MAG: Glycosyl transferase group 1 [Candidatus Amesbacteria bacterium GW2011_GWC2_47_8]